MSIEMTQEQLDIPLTTKPRQLAQNLGSAFYQRVKEKISKLN